MNKIEIRRLLESEEKDTIKNLGALRDKAEEEAKQDTVSRCPVDLEVVQTMISELLAVLEPMQNYFDNHPTYDWERTQLSNAYFYLTSTLNTGVLIDLGSNICMKYSSESAIRIRYDNQLEIVRGEYAKIRGNISKMSGKEATEYLIDIGFALPSQSIPVPISNEVMSPINVSLLKELRGAINV